MKKEHQEENILKKLLQGRAAIVGTVAVTVFLCFFTLFEFTALYLEWEIPVLKVVTGEEKSWFAGDYKQEIALDDSKENVPFLEQGTGSAGTGQDALPEENTGTGGNGQTGGSNGEPGGSSRERSGGNGEPGGSNGQAIGKQLEDETGVSENGQPGEQENAVGNTETANGKENMQDTEAVESTENSEQPEFPYYIRINRRQNCVTVYTLDEKGEYTIPYKAMVCSTGLYNATPLGTFRISDKYLWRELYGGVYGQYATRIHGGVLFHSVPYYKKAKNTLCTEKYNKLGQQASMGCVRLTTKDAKWIADNCPAGTTVEIYDDDDPGPLGKPQAEKLAPDDPKRGWDPTDPDEENPWREWYEEM